MFPQRKLCNNRFFKNIPQKRIGKNSRTEEVFSIYFRILFITHTSLSVKIRFLLFSIA